MGVITEDMYIREELIKEYPHLCCAEIAEKFEEITGKSVNHRCIYNQARKLGFDLSLRKSEKEKKDEFKLSRNGSLLAQRFDSSLRVSV